MRTLRSWILHVIMALLVVFLAWLRYSVSLRPGPSTVPVAQPGLSAGERAFLPDARVGEKITYDIKMGPATLGRCVFQNLKQSEYKGRPINLIVFETQMARFRDRETIYSDAEVFLPLRVERDIRAWPNYEVIIEEYDQQRFTLVITSRKGRKEEVARITKQAPIHNAILLPYHVRIIEGVEPGWAMQVNLPTQEFKIKLVRMEEIRVPAGRFPAYYFESEPKRFQIWITADSRRIPVKIAGSGAVGYTLAMREYQREADAGQ